MFVVILFRGGNMKEIIKKWWFWLIIIVLILWAVIGIREYKENKEIEAKFKAMAEGMTEYYESVKNVYNKGEFLY